MLKGKQDRWIIINCRIIHKRIDFSLWIDRKQPLRSSEILPVLLGCHQEFVSDIMRLRQPFGFNGSGRHGGKHHPAQLHGIIICRCCSFGPSI